MRQPSPMGFRFPYRPERRYRAATRATIRIMRPATLTEHPDLAGCQPGRGSSRRLTESGQWRISVGMDGGNEATRSAKAEKAGGRKGDLARTFMTLATAEASESERRADLLARAKVFLETSRGLVRQRFEDNARGDKTVRALSDVTDELVIALAETAAEALYPAPNPSSGDLISLVAVGGYGRREMAPESDIDLLFLLPYKLTPRAEQIVEFLLYMLWDLGLKVGHATRTVDECLRQARADQTIATALLESRHLWGARSLTDELQHRYREEVAAGPGTDFIEAKLAEAETRHRKLGDSRYVLEPNIKDGKGGLRDLQTLYWIAKFAYDAHNVSELVAKGVLKRDEAQRFRKAANFLHTLRCHMHWLTGRAEERLTFDLQPELARLTGYRDQAGASSVERLMKHFFVVARDVGDLTRILCAAIDAERRRKPRFRLPSLRRTKKLEPFRLDGGWLNLETDTDLTGTPTNFIRLFLVSHNEGLDIHPAALRLVARNLKHVNRALRDDEEANALFIELLTSRKNPERSLRQMKEAGVLGRFVPEFGRVSEQMQFDMYHVYTVGEHTLRALGILSRIEAGELEDMHPIASEVIGKVISRRALYVALLLHDIAKGRRGDHSVLGARVARKLGPRFGLDEEEVETASWLVRWHLAMSNVAFRRDIADTKTIQDFAELVQSPERLRLLLCLTVADIRAVGPNVWNNWKAQLLRDLYRATDEIVSGNPSVARSASRIAEAQGRLREALPEWSEEEFQKLTERGYPQYWLTLPTDTHIHHARLMREADAEGAGLTVRSRVDTDLEATQVTVYTPDHPGLFARLAGAITMSGASIVAARIFTMADGMAIDDFWLQGADGGPFDRSDKLARLAVNIERSIGGELSLRRPADDDHPFMRKRLKVFPVAPRVLVDNKASNAHTVIEVNGRDRPGLLYDVTRCLADLNLRIAAAKISTYGERVVDVFYVKDLFGLKIENAQKLKQARAALLEVLDPSVDGEQAAASGK